MIELFSPRLSKFLSAPDNALDGVGRACFVISVFLFYFLIISILYRYFIVIYWSYTGFVFVYSPFNLVLSLAVIFSVGFCFPNNVCAKNIFYSFLILLQLMPALVLFSFGGWSFYSAFCIFYSIFLCIFAAEITSKYFFINYLSIRLPSWVRVEYMLLILSAGFVFFAATKLGLSNFNLNPSRVYEFRRQELEGIEGFSYFLHFVMKVAIPMSVVIFASQRKYLLLILALILSLLIYGFSSHKSAFLLAILALFIFVIVNNVGNLRALYLVFLCAVMVGVADFLLFQYWAKGWDTPFGWYSSIVIRRGVFVPSYLNYVYVDFFRDHEKYLWSTSRITFGLISNPYGLPMPNLVGLKVFGTGDLSANTGFIGSGYGQAGVFGMSAYAIGLGFLIGLFDMLGKKISHGLVVAAVSAQMLTAIMSSDFLTSLLTHGILISVAILYFYQNSSNLRETKT